MTSIIISHKLNEISMSRIKLHYTRRSTIETLVKVWMISEAKARIIKGMVVAICLIVSKADAEDWRGAYGGSDWTVYHPVYEGRKVVDGVNFNVRRGEVVGISGLMGAGRTELAMSIFGRSYGTHITGTLKINGKEVHLKNVKEAIDAKLAYHRRS
jgi:putative multiple sugar transport system ATP-binding protein